MHVYIYIYIYIYINSKTNFILQRFRSHFGVYTCIYIHIERERAREGSISYCTVPSPL